MANTAATSPGTMADDATVGTVAWSNPDNAKVSDNAYATYTTTFTTRTTHYLKATNFGFSIPTGATINGILVEVERKYSGNGVADGPLGNAIIKADGTLTSGASYVGWSTTEQYDSYGGSTDLWGETWTAEDINDVDFGFAMYAVINGNFDSGGATASVDHIRTTIYYTAGATANTTNFFF